MTTDQLKDAQRTLRATNARMCAMLGVGESTLCNWKSGRWPIPLTAQLAIKYLIYEHNRA